MTIGKVLEPSNVITFMMINMVEDFQCHVLDS